MWIPFYFRYKYSFNKKLILILLFLLLIILSSCTQADDVTKEISITIYCDNSEKIIDVPVGSTVQMVLEKSGIEIGNLDEVDPPSYTILSKPTDISVKRIREEFKVEESIIPFTRQTVRNESLPEGQELLIQPGINGVQQITYRQVIENDLELSRTLIKSVTIAEAKPEIVMVGVQTPFMAVPLQGVIAYLSAGNAWLMEDNTGNRRPLVTTGDLDGRVFSLSPDRRWLLFTRKSDKDPAERINTLWAIDIQQQKPEMVYLNGKNIIHFADWLPNTKWMVAYSTVEPRSTPPGWQANNDLIKLAIDEEGKVIQITELIPASSGGIYGWWGTNYSWSPDGKRIAYARPDSVGLVDLSNKTLVPLLDIIPLQTRSDWAWIPGIGWSTDHRVLYTTIHAPKSGLSSDEISPLFDLVAIIPEINLSIPLASQSGMFAYPVPYPNDSGQRNQVAYLQAVFPEQSESSRYRLIIMDRDGSNRNVVFPTEGKPGLSPQKIVWEPVENNTQFGLGVIYEDNLWIIRPENGEIQQITGDSSISRIDWK